MTFLFFFFFFVHSSMLNLRVSSDRRNFSRVYAFSNLVYVRRSIGRRWFARFLCIGKSSVARKKFAHAEGARGWWATARFTDSDKWIRRSIIPRPKCISRRYDRMDVCSYRARPISNSSAGFSMLSGQTSQTTRVAPILRDHYARYLLSSTVRK